MVKRASRIAKYLIVNDDASRGILENLKERLET